MTEKNEMLAETPTKASPTLGKECAWRMDAYYYGFGMTGLAVVDKILSAVACAGKAYHHTDCWQDESSPYEHLRGESCEEWIQNAANDAAAAIRAAAPSASAQQAEPRLGRLGFAEFCDERQADESIRVYLADAWNSGQDFLREKLADAGVYVLERADGCWDVAAHAPSASPDALTDAEIDAVWCNLDARGSTLYEPHQWQREMRLRFARALLAQSAATEPLQGTQEPEAGWKLVPVEPSKEMLGRFDAQNMRGTARWIWTEMIDAAPAPKDES